jgi:hypothetical protein
MATNPNLTYGKVTGFYSRVFVDGTDAGAEPETVSHEGMTVLFTPSRKVVVNPTAKATIQIDPFPATTDENGFICTLAGDAGIGLPASIDPLINESGWTWNVTLQGGTGNYPYESYDFTLAPGQDLDLADVVKVPSNVGTSLLQWAAAVAATSASVEEARALIEAMPAVPTEPDDIGAEPAGLSPATKTGLTATFVARWAPLTAYALGAKVVSPSGVTVTAKVAFTSGTAYIAANWDLPADLAAKIDKTEALSTFVPRWKANTAYALGDKVISPGGETVNALAGFTSGTTFDASKWAVSTEYARNAGWAIATDPQWGIKGDGITDDSTAINAMLQAVYAGKGGNTYTGGVAYFPARTYIGCGIELRSRVVMRGAGKRATTFKAPAGSTLPVFTLRPGPVQASFVEDLEVLGVGNAGQHGIRLTSAASTNSTSGGWWESGMRHVRVSGFAGHQIWLDGGDSSSANLLPHQFLHLEHVEAFSIGGLRALNVTGQVGQVTYNTCQFEGDGVVATETTDGASVYIGASGYSHVFTNTTFQENLYGVIVDGASPVVLNGCYWENVGRSVLATGGARLVTVGTPSFSFAAHVSDGTGYLFKAEAASFLKWDSVKAGGTVDRIQSSDTTSNIVAGTYFGPTAPGSGSVGVTKNIAESGGTITLGTAATTILVNASANIINNIAGTVRLPGESVYLKAHGGSITLGLGGNISIGKLTGTLVVPPDAWVHLVRTDSGSLGWAVVGMSPA